MFVLTLRASLKVNQAEFVKNFEKKFKWKDSPASFSHFNRLKGSVLCNKEYKSFTTNGLAFVLDHIKARGSS